MLSPQIVQKFLEKFKGNAVEYLIRSQGQNKHNCFKQEFNKKVSAYKTD